MKKNQATIDAVRAYIAERNHASTAAIMAGAGLSKSQVAGALRVLHAEGAVVSEGATLSRVHRLASAGDAPPPSTTRRTRKATKKKTRKTTRARTRRAPKAEASLTPAPTALDIAMDDAGRVRLTREGAPPFVLQTPEEHQRAFAFLDRMSPVWSEP